MHHVALIPALHTHQRRIRYDAYIYIELQLFDVLKVCNKPIGDFIFRAFRDLQKVIEELMAAEPQWRNSFSALRNRELLRRWRRQIKRLHR